MGILIELNERIYFIYRVEEKITVHFRNETLALLYLWQGKFVTVLDGLTVRGRCVC